MAHPAYLLSPPLVGGLVHEEAADSSNDDTRRILMQESSDAIGLGFTTAKERSQPRQKALRSVTNATFMARCPPPWRQRALFQIH
jgi:hypothetical protein